MNKKIFASTSAYKMNSQFGQINEKQRKFIVGTNRTSTWNDNNVITQRSNFVFMKMVEEHQLRHNTVKINVINFTNVDSKREQEL